MQTILDCNAAVHAELPAHNLRALWHNEMRPMTSLPDTACVPHLWGWKEQREIVMREVCLLSTRALHACSTCDRQAYILKLLL